MSTHFRIWCLYPEVIYLFWEKSNSPYLYVDIAIDDIDIDRYNIWHTYRIKVDRDELDNTFHFHLGAAF